MKAAHAQAKASFAAFQAAAEKLGIPATSISTNGTIDSPNYRWDGVRIYSYTSSASITVCTKDFEQVADIVDTAVASGVGSASVSYRATNMPEHKKKARDLAITAAKEKAEQLAKGMNASLGEVQSLSEGTSWSSGVGNVIAQVESSDFSGAYAPGSTPLELTISAVFKLE
jgi:uncharacterized protein YggE